MGLEFKFLDQLGVWGGNTGRQIEEALVFQTLSL